MTDRLMKEKDFRAEFFPGMSRSTWWRFKQAQDIRFPKPINKGMGEPLFSYAEGAEFVEQLKAGRAA